VTTKIGLNRATLPVSPIDKPLGSLSIQPVGPTTLFRSANTMLRDALGGLQRHPTTSCACHRSGLGRESVIANPEHLKGTHIWAVPEDAVGCEPVSAPNSLLTGKLTGNLPISGVSAANLTTSLRACARPDRATWAACRRRRGDRVVFFAAIAHSRYWHFSDLARCPT